MRPTRLLSILVAFAVLIVTGSCSQEAVETARPNILLITIDTLRADRLGSFGFDEETSPFLDQLAVDSTVFEKAMTPIGTTLPAHASIFTGLYPRDHGLRKNGLKLDDRFLTLPERLLAANYSTQAVVSKPSLLSRGGLVQGFRFPPNPGKFRTVPGPSINTVAKKWLSSPRKKPFFLWLHYFEVHSPYRLTPYAKSRLGGYKGPLKDGASTDLFYKFGKEELPATVENRNALHTLYGGEVAEADNLVADIVRSLKETGQLDNTILLITSDHGQSLGEHGEVGHGGLVTEEVLRVPLIIHGPGVRKGHRVSSRVSLIDLFPTILELAGAEPPPGCSGRSLVSALSGDELAEGKYFAETNIGKKNPDTVAVLVGNKKLVVGKDGAHFIDLELDPQENSPQPPGETELLREMMEMAIRHKKIQPRFEAKEMGDEAREHLRSLGYIE